MLVAIDVGNTNMVFGIYQNGTLAGSFRLVTGKRSTSDEIGLTVCEYFRRFELDVSQVEDVIIASVVPSIMHTLCNAMYKYLCRWPIVVNEQVFPPLKYHSGATTNDHGADRSVACTAAIQKYGTPLVVLDFGTATTVDAVDRQGIYVGGSICAGLRVTMNALAQNAALLPHVDLSLPKTMLGYDTVTQIQSGVVGGYVGSMEYLIRRTKAEMEEPDDSIKVVATGGLARLVASNTGLIDVVDSQLILDGLFFLYQQYKKN